jgi:enoyl-CoA hydratase/carnithine racemase
VTAPEVETVRPGDAGGWAALQAAARSRSTDGALLVDAGDGGRLDDDPVAVSTALQRLARAPRPVVVLLGGRWDAAGLALLLGGTVGYVHADLRIALDDVPVLLALGLPGDLQRAVGPPAARRLLLERAHLDAGTAVRLGLAEPADDTAAGITAARLAGSTGARLLLRSLTTAARSTPDQARRYDAELRHVAGG